MLVSQSDSKIRRTKVRKITHNTSSMVAESSKGGRQKTTYEEEEKKRMMKKWKKMFEIPINSPVDLEKANLGYFPALKNSIKIVDDILSNFDLTVNQNI